MLNITDNIILVVVCVLLIYAVSLSILCVSWEELSHSESNQQICDFYKPVTFEKQRHGATLYKINFRYQEIIHSMKYRQLLKQRTGGVKYVFMGVSFYWPCVCCVYVCEHL